MKIWIFGWIAVCLLAQGAVAQVVAPASPKKFVPRAIGGGTSGGVQILPREEKPKTLRHTTRMLLSQSRVWTSNDGKPVEARLIAFEDMVVEVPEGAPAPEPPPAPKHPTVIRDGKARLLVNNKPMEVALSRLSQADQDFVEQIRKAHAPKETQEP